MPRRAIRASTAAFLLQRVLVLSVAYLNSLRRAGQQRGWWRCSIDDLLSRPLTDVAARTLARRPPWHPSRLLVSYRPLAPVRRVDHVKGLLDTSVTGSRGVDPKTLRRAGLHE